MTVDLDPEDWEAFRATAHKILDGAIDHVAAVRSRPVWQPMPAGVRSSFEQPLPRHGVPIEIAYGEIVDSIAPYTTGNVHPGFMGWVHGGGTAVGMLAELIAGSFNANLGGRDHAPIALERQVIRWAAEMVGLPGESSGLLVTGSSLANLIAVLVARSACLGSDVRRSGVAGRRLVAYAGQSAHSCIGRAMDMAGLGTSALRLIPSGESQGMDVAALAGQIQADRQEGALPFLVVGTAGTVGTGAVDDLRALAALCQQQKLWYHVDGAFGATARLSRRYRSLLDGIEAADSVALDFHKWMQVPYDAGCILVRHPDRQIEAFSQEADYLRREDRGLAAGEIWPCDLGPDLSRGFRALKVWLTLKVFGTDRLAMVVDRSCHVARYIAARVSAEPELELMAPVTLNIVCFRYRAPADADMINREIVADVQESGIAAPSTTRVAGALVIRAAIVNHRTREEDADRMIEAVLKFGRMRVK